MKQVFTIAAGSNGPIWFVIGIGAFCFVLVLLFVYLAYSSRHMRVVVSSDALSISGTLYGRRIPFESLVLDEARVLDLAREREYRPRWRTNGAGLPGFSAGWFKLRNGQKTLTFVTQGEVAYIPTRAGYSVMVSVVEPGELIQALKARDL